MLMAILCNWLTINLVNYCMSVKGKRVQGVNNL